MIRWFRVVFPDTAWAGVVLLWLPPLRNQKPCDR